MATTPKPVKRTKAVSPAQETSAAASVSPDLTPVEVQVAGESSLEERIEEIRRAAYERFLKRGQGAGDEISDWLGAEAELAQRDVKETPAEKAPGGVRKARVEIARSKAREAGVEVSDD